jgi:2-polyprenyl-6-methoxyphenol hydroxylase-like FAD-dependent oxidoreductase
MKNAIIIGGGVAGLVSSISLRRIGISTRIIEARKCIGASQLTYTGLWDPSVKILEQLGIYDDIKRKMKPVLRSTIRSKGGYVLIRPGILNKHPGMSIGSLRTL